MKYNESKQRSRIWRKKETWFHWVLDQMFPFFVCPFVRCVLCVKKKTKRMHCYQLNSNYKGQFNVFEFPWFFQICVKSLAWMFISFFYHEADNCEQCVYSLEGTKIKKNTTITTEQMYWRTQNIAENPWVILNCICIINRFEKWWMAYIKWVWKSNLISHNKKTKWNKLKMRMISFFCSFFWVVFF